MTTIYPDVSKWQVVVDDSFNRDFFMFRAETEYAAIDSHAKANLAWSIEARASGKIQNFGVYVLPGFASINDLLVTLNNEHVPRDCVIMSDEESWSGKVTGDHSVSFNQLVEALRARQSGRADLVWSYFNRGDGATLHPHRPSWLDFIIAGYNGNDPRDEYPNCIGWQYTNGITNRTSWPSSTPPFGRCDHNALFVPIPDPVVGTNYDELEDDLPTAKEIAEAVVAEPIKNTLVEGGLSEPLGTRVLKAQAYANSANQNAATALAKVTAMQSALEQIGTEGGVIDYGQVQAAVEAALANTHLEVG